MNKEKKVMLIIGAVIGFINGLFGGGGGMIAVPIFEKYLGYENKQAHATAIAVILPISLVTSLVYLLGGSFDFKIGLWCSAGVVLGGSLGAVLLSKLKSTLIGKIFALVMLISGIKLLVW